MQTITPMTDNLSFKRLLCLVVYAQSRCRESGRWQNACGEDNKLSFLPTHSLRTKEHSMSYIYLNDLDTIVVGNQILPSIFFLEKVCFRVVLGKLSK